MNLEVIELTNDLFVIFILVTIFLLALGAFTLTARFMVDIYDDYYIALDEMAKKGYEPLEFLKYKRISVYFAKKKYLKAKKETKGELEE